MRSQYYSILISLILIAKDASADFTASVTFDDKNELRDALNECLNAGVDFKVIGMKVTIRPNGWA